MNQVNELKEILGDFLDWNKARLDCFTKMLLAMFVVKTVNLKEIATALSGNTKIESRYKRIKSFFREFDFDQSQISAWVMKLFFSNDKKFYLIIDRTNWFWGKAKINILTLAISYEGIAIPIFWQLLNKAGNSTSKEQQAIIKKFIKQFGKDRIAGFLADREFTSKELFSWLKDNKIPFYIRIKSNTGIKVFRSKQWQVERLFKPLLNKQVYVYPNDVELYGERLRVVGSRSERGDLLIVATNADPKNAISIYLRRWEIENLFQSLKSRGFRFEDTHMTKLARLNKMMSLLTVGFCWAHKVGEWRANRCPIKFNQYRNNKRQQYTFFRYGLDWIRDTLIQFTQKWRQFRQALRVLLTPKSPFLEGLS